ncbi:hypothetical protein PHYPSEUDO_002092 [Phytophthora pseudosyringae]|uniref:Uncharacterized protein n=1 Tax=Phytophthora pseudosyringae TaxID=221518 RepID=A0A8T1VVI0_9STRA|nr:hypothetical protein PHYPSEUDO_002092 [Phytophthora pseudosyringae]
MNSIDFVEAGCRRKKQRLQETEPVVQATHKSGTDDVVEYFYPRSNIVLPFSLRSSLWELGENRYCNRPAFERYLNVEDPNNTVVARFVARNVLNTGTIGQKQQQFIARRFVEDDRIVITWKFISEGDGIFSGMKVDETEWWRLLPSTDVAEAGTVVEMWTHRVPMQCRDLPSRESAMDEFHDVLQANSEETLDDVVASLVNVPL